VFLLVLLLGAPAASSSRAASAKRSSTANGRRAAITLARMASKKRKQQPPLEDPETLLAERDDLRVQVSTKNSEFLAQHRRADQLLLKVRDLELRLRSEGRSLRTAQTQLQVEEIKERSLEVTLNKVRAALGESPNSTEVAMSAPITPDAEERIPFTETSSAMQHDPQLEMRASQKDHRASPVLHTHRRAPMVSHKSKAPAAAVMAHAVANAPVASVRPLNAIKLKRVDSPEMRRPEHVDSRQESRSQEFAEPHDSSKVPQSRDKEEGSNTFSELEKQLQEEDSKIAKLDSIDQEDDTVPQEHPLAVSALVLDTSLRDVSAGDAQLHPKATEHVNSDNDLAPLDAASEADAALLASMTRR